MNNKLSQDQINDLIQELDQNIHLNGLEVKDNAFREYSSSQRLELVNAWNKYILKKRRNEGFLIPRLDI
jgi:hypothetical protein